jgi:high-affinity iron transporter
MLTTVIIILREFLEGALLLSLLAALHTKHHLYRHWMLAALLLGMIGAFFYARAIASISEYFDGRGQEIINSLSLSVIALSLGLQIAGFSFFYPDRPTTAHNNNTALHILLALSAMLIIIMAITREGAEIFVYYSSINIQPAKTSSMFIGGIIGVGLGICMGILIFVMLCQLTAKNLMFTTSALLILVTAGLFSEAMRSLIQAGLVAASEPLWNSSHLIPESSIAGQLLYAVFAYEATPTREELTVWLMTALSLSCMVVLIHARNQQRSKK